MARFSEGASVVTSAPPVRDALVLDRDDDVATALRDLPSGTTIRAQSGDREIEVTLTEPIPLCHKLALRPLAPGAPIRKFGQVIGAATMPIAAGAWVHVHNLASLRARRTTGEPGSSS